jgi:hypothetical protein
MRIGHYREGVYGEHVAWRFENLLGRSMWEFSSQAAEPRFLITGRSHLGRPVPAETPPNRATRAADPLGALTALDGGEPAGVALPFRRRIAKLSMRSWRTSGQGLARSPRSRFTTGSSAVGAETHRYSKVTALVTDSGHRRPGVRPYSGPVSPALFQVATLKRPIARAVRVGERSRVSRARTGGRWVCRSAGRVFRRRGLASST